MTMQYRSEIPRDVSVNTFAFTGSGSDREADANSITTKLSELYNGKAIGQTNFLSYYFGAYTMRTGSPLTMRVYDLADAKPRPPFYTVGLGITGIGTDTQLPLEVAAVLSFQGDRQAGTPQSRRRGRIFFGPLTASAIGMDPSSKAPIVTETFRRDAALACRTLAADDSDGTQWCVWSRVDSEFVPVTSGWVDNDPDTIRKRGLRASDRETWSINV